MEPQASLSIIVSTFPDKNSASFAAETLVKEKLAACVSIGGELCSTFFWQEKLETQAEFPLIIKTSSQLSAQLFCRLADLHPYDTPEIISFTPENVYQPYLDWVINCSSKK